jgi:predicted transposase YdaD
MAIEQMRNDSVQEGELNRAYQIAKRMLERGKNTVEEIAEDTGLPIETIRELAGEKSA